jgi:hypothetical protein
MSSEAKGGQVGRDNMVGRDRRGGRDRARINLGEASEAEYWAKALGVSTERLAALIEKVGDRVEAVRAEIAEERARTRDGDK